MGGKALVGECSRCHLIRKIRKLSGLCYSCHWHSNILPKVKLPDIDKIISSTGPELERYDPETADENEKRRRVILAANRLFKSWNFVTVEWLEEQELAAWDLIEKIEDLLGKV